MRRPRARPRRRCTALVAIWCLACGVDDTPTRSRSTSVIVAYWGGDLNPDTDDSVKFLVFLPLVAEDEQGELEGRLLRSWENSPDSREWTLHLRSDVRWHDGTPVTGHDIAFTLQLLRRPEIAPDFFSVTDFESVSVPDDSTVILRFSEPSQPLDPWDVYYPRHLLERLDPARFYEWDFWTHPVGNGPYRVVRHVPRASIEFEANPEYFRGKPSIERVVLRLVTSDAGLSDVLKGDVDVVWGADETQIPKLAAAPLFRPYFAPYTQVGRAIYWKSDHPLFRDPRVRRALSQAVNRPELRRLLNLPESVPILDGFATPRQFRRGEFPEPLPYDRAAAAELLAAAGWLDRDADGVREREGREFSFVALVGSWPGFEEMAVYVQEAFRRVGVAVELRRVDIGLLLARLKEGDFEAAFALAVAGPWLGQFRFGEGPPLGYRSAQATDILNRLAIATEPSDVDRLYSEFMDILRADYPLTLLLPSVETHFAHHRIRGLSSPWRADPLRYMEELWVEGEP